MPDDVAIQILIPAKKEWIKKSVEAMKDVKMEFFIYIIQQMSFKEELFFKK